MVDINKLKQDMAHEAKAELAVEKLELHFQQSSAEKLQESAHLRKEASMAKDPNERKELLDRADVANKESIAHKEKANHIASEPESYKQSYLEKIKGESEKANDNEKEPSEPEAKEATQEKAKGEKDKTADDKSKTEAKTEDKDTSKESQSKEDKEFEPTAGDQIKDAWDTQSVFDKAWAEMLGSIADRMQTNYHNEKQKTADKAAER